MNAEDEGTIRFGDLNDDGSGGYWAYILKNNDDTYEAFWNGEYGANHAHNSLGAVTLQDRDVGECFANRSVLLCNNIPFDTPIYYVDSSTPDHGGNILLAYVNGVEFHLTHPKWDDIQPFSVGQSSDLDGDGRLETLIYASHGGNCCPARISVASYRGDGFFTFLDETPIEGGWRGADIIDERGSQILRVYDRPTGVENVDLQRGERDYVVIGGRIALVAERGEHSVISGIANLLVEDVKRAEGSRKAIVFDINSDGAPDQISCSYWQRWGIMNCQADISGLEGSLGLQCKSIVISPVVFGEKQAHRLMCDHESVDY